MGQNSTWLEQGRCVRFSNRARTCSGFKVKFQIVSVFLYWKYYHTKSLILDETSRWWNWHNLVLKSKKKLLKEKFVLQSSEYVKYITDLNFDIYFYPLARLFTMLRKSKIFQCNFIVNRNKNVWQPFVKNGKGFKSASGFM